MATTSGDIVTSFAKGLQVLECFCDEEPRLSVTDVANRTGLDRASARRSLLTLYHCGYADYDGKYFSLTSRALRLGMSALASLALPDIVQPWIDQLADQIGQSCSVSILDGRDIVYVARAAQRRVMTVNLMPGSRLPAHCTSMGRVLLASLPIFDARAIVERSNLTPRTRFSLTNPDEIMEQILCADAKGYAHVDQEIEIGLRSLAVPVRNASGQTVAALNTGMAASHEKAEDMVTAFLPALLKTQAGLQRSL